MSGNPKQVDYHKVSPTLPPKYRYMQVFPSNLPNASIAGLTQNSVPIQFKIPGGVVFNFAQSKLGYCIDAAAQANLQYTWIVDDCLAPFMNVQLADGNGTLMVDMQYAQRWSKLSDKLYSDRTEFMTRSPSDLSYPSNVVAGSNVAVPITTVTAPNVYNYPAQITANQGFGFASYAEPKYFAIGAVANSAANPATGALAVAKYIKLGHLRNTLFERDVNLYFGQSSVYLNLTTAPLSTFVFSTLSATVMNTPIATTAAVNLNQLCLYLAVEDNQLIRDSVIQKYNHGGINLRSDYLAPYQNLITGPAAQVGFEIPQQKAKLKRIINGIFAPTQTVGGLTDAQNVNGAKLTTYQSTIGDKQLQNYLVSCLFSTNALLLQGDYRENEQYLRNSILGGIGQYQTNFMHIDDFSGFDAITHNEERANEETGIDLNVPRHYQIAMTLPNNQVALHTWAILSKDLHVGPDGIAWM